MWRRRLRLPPMGTSQAAPPRKGLTGVPPGDFPRDLPIYLAFEHHRLRQKDGRRFVLLQTSDARSGVEAWLRQAAAGAGFRVEGGGGHFTLRKGGRSFALAVSGQDTAEFRYSY